MAAGVLLAGALAGCARPQAAPGRVVVVASSYPLYEFARQIAADRAEVLVLVPPGVAPHDYEPTPRDVVRLRSAKVVIVNGRGLEPWADRLLADLPAVRVVAAEAAAPVLTGAGLEADPHLWLDPVAAEAVAAAVAAALARADPAGEPVYRQAEARLRQELRSLHRAYRDGLASCRHREFLAAHAAFGYLAARYGLVQIAISGPTAEAEPSPARMASLAALARARGLRVIFADPRRSRKAADVLAREVGARVLPLSDLETVSEADLRRGRSYVAAMYENLRSLREGLGCR
ncbi:MAG: zinc ABC transporter substrate-binding protein [Armatimonadota bacterium]|nr:zinc ABC transporter substrate-binding protein [Armatimonadota bacterium]MDR7400883.1 zinc ABC transporter substrate-binding protein [Armatimonadota bacterium]MDR7404203.1 zinc ABC transporter substrate-binding protein [Armatimonadota bacterium]MDR7437399.1 zinc ABC transporter substrate-binding protein [Armatimonadota bacterium]MDR7472785.1 zinc ABC transporter substrate-binding protein [Armatimonadota bacterium]